MGACGSNTKKPVTIVNQPQTVAPEQPSQQKDTRGVEPNAKPVDAEKSKKLIKVRIIKDDEQNLTNHVFEKQYEENTIFTQIIEDLHNKNNIIDKKSDYNFKLLIPKIKSDDRKFAAADKYDLTAGKKLKSTLKDILSNRVSDTTAIFEFSYSGLDLPQDVRKTYIGSNNLFGSPRYDDYEPFGISVYDKTSGVLHYYSIPDEIFEKANINIKLFNNFSAYCCGANKLYINGGIYEDNLFVDQFVEIDLQKLHNSSENNEKDYVKNLPNLIHARGMHSMIYVPNKYLYIVGGSNTNSVELYDIDKNVITHDSNLNIMRQEAALCVVNNHYLYAFCGYIDNFEKPIEKLNLKKANREWEVVKFKNSSSIKLDTYYFTVAYGKTFNTANSINSDEIILISANENYSYVKSEEKTKKNYLFKETANNEHILEEVTLDESDQPYVSRERLFIPVDNNNSILMPYYFYENMKILRFNSEAAKLDEIKFDAVENQEEVFVVERIENKTKIDNSQANPINAHENRAETNQKAIKEK
jgi:hypothetical protein